MTREEYLRRVTLLRENMKARAVTYNWHDPETSFTEAVLSRGDRRIGPLLRDIWEQGGYLESWSEGFSMARWEQAAARTGVDLEFYANRAPGTGRGSALGQDRHGRPAGTSDSGARAVPARGFESGLPCSLHRLRRRRSAEGRALRWIGSGFCMNVPAERVELPPGYHAYPPAGPAPGVGAGAVQRGL